MYSWKKDIASWKIDRTLYMSVVFTWHLPKAREMALAHKGPVAVGGPAVSLMPDYLSDVAAVGVTLPYPPLAFHNPLATFTTRGCIRDCSFCAVPHTEGDFRELNQWEARPLICDNNLLASSRRHFDRVIDSLKGLSFVDFNQGLQASLFTSYHARRIAELLTAKVRFSFDHSNDEGVIMDAIRTARDAGLNNLGVYVLVGHDDSPEDAIYRLEVIRSLGVDPNPMRFQPLTTLQRNEYLAPGWDEFTMQKVMQYYSRLVPMRICGIPFDDFEPKTTARQGVLL